MKEFDINLLNDEQREATNSNDSKILCLAGAGTGKTRTLVSRIKRLLEDGVNPGNILCLTFTRLAGLEMKERVGAKGEKIFINTFHSFCHKVIEDNLQYFKVEENFVILNEEEKTILLEDIMKDLKIKAKRDLVESCLTTLKPLKATKEIKDAEIVAKEYRYRLMLDNALDIDVLLSDVVKAFDKEEALRTKYREKFTYIFIDEMQDTDDLQMSFVNNINPENLFLVGDDYQSIYGFRGTKVEYILDLSKNPDFKLYELKQNYRSTKEIIAVAENLIKHNATRTNKSLITHKTGKPVEYHELENEDAEYQFIIDTICYSGRELSDFTVISRTNRSINALAKKMEEQKIPSRILGRKLPVLESVNTRNYLLLLDAIRNLSSERVSNLLVNTFFSKEESEDIRIKAVSEGKSLDEILLDMTGHPLVEFLFEAIVEEPMNMDVIHGHLFLSSKDYVLENFDSFGMNQLHTFMLQWKKAMLSLDSTYDTSIMEFLNWMKTKDPSDVELVQRENYGEVVKLTTAHSSKGLEFPIVFLMGMNEEVFPVKKINKKNIIEMNEDKMREKLTGIVRDYEAEQLEEERRLAFVAATRAMEKLYVTRPVKIMKSWSLFETTMKPSRFIAEMGL